MLCVVGSSAGMEKDYDGTWCGIPWHDLVDMLPTSLVPNVVPDEKKPLNSITENLMDQLFDAVKHSQLDLMKKIITHNPDIVSAYRYWPDLKEEVIPLHLAAYYGTVTSLELLLGDKNKARAQCDAETKEWKRVPLHYAANKTIAKILLKHRDNTNKKDVFGKKPFATALDDWPARYDVAHYVLKHGRDSWFKVNAVDRFTNYTMLHNAAGGNLFDNVNFLLRHNANPAVYNNDGQTPLQMAIKGWHWQTIDVFKKAGIFFISSGQCELFKLLHNNAQKLRSLVSGTHYEVGTVNLLAQLLIGVRSGLWYGQGQEIVISSDGITFKHSSRNDLCKLFGKKSIEYVEQLIDECHARVKVNGNIFNWRGPEFKRELQKYPFVVAYDKDEAFDIVLKIMENGDTDLFEWLFTDNTSYSNGGLVFKPDLSGVDCDGNTLLHRAAMHGNTVALMILIKNDINLLTQRNNAGKTVLDLIQACSNKDYVKGQIICINDAIAKIFLTTPSHDPEYKNIKNFLKSGFDINACIVNDIKTTVLHWAAREDYQKCLFLLKNGASVNVQDDDGHSPLFFVVRESSFIKNPVDTIMLLLKYGALITERMIECADSDYVRALLQQQYEEQICCVCYDQFLGMPAIPCAGSHGSSRLCEGCYTSICEKHGGKNPLCPLCRKQLGDYIKNITV